MDKRNGPRLSTDDIFAFLMLWTFIGWIGMLFGLNIGWWDVLIALGLVPEGWLPANPRSNT